MSELSTNLNTHEKTIELGLTTFVEVGTALAAIRDGKLWMAGGKYASFEAYCKTRWGWNKSYAHQITQSAAVVKNLSAIADKPKNEAQARPLAKLPESEQADAWEEAVEEAKAEGKKPTAAKVQEVVTRRMKPAEAEEWEPVGDDEIELPVEETMGDSHAPENQQKEDGDNPDTLECVQADVIRLSKSVRAVAEDVRKTLNFKENDAQRPWCSRFSIISTVKLLLKVARDLERDMPAGGTADKPITKVEAELSR